MKILVVDDSKVARLSIMKLIRAIYPETEFTEAENGAIALEHFKNNSFAVIFLDLTMPVMDGFEALEKMMEINREAQVIVISADVQAKAKLQVLQLGAKNMIAKPINQEKMQEILTNDVLL